jgi:acyl-CoA synthetase (AMP-forming)/AMP-acid ligase II
MTRAETTSLNDLLRKHAEHHPHCVAYSFVRGSEEPEESLTYLELYRYARAVALQLIAHDGVEHGDRVLLLFPPGPDFIKYYFASLFAAAIAVPIYPSFKDIRLLEHIVADCTPKIIVSCREIRECVRSCFGGGSVLTRVRWHVPDLAPDFSLQHPEPVDLDQIATLRYTSGSTGKPNGVALTHRNVMANLRAIRRRSRNRGGQLDAAAPRQGWVWWVGSSAPCSAAAHSTGNSVSTASLAWVDTPPLASAPA